MTQPVYITAELGVNHEGDVDKAKDMISYAKKCGADACKVQMFDPVYYQGDDSIELNRLSKWALSRDSFVRLQDHARDVDIALYATAFDITTLDWLVSRNVPFLKIASPDLANYKLIEAAATTSNSKTPRQYGNALAPYVILSSGGATMNEIRVASSIMRIHSKPFVMMHCVSAYPCNYANNNLRRIKMVHELSKSNWCGFSDHSGLYEIPGQAAAAGAEYVELHFCLPKDVGCPEFTWSHLDLKLSVNHIRYTEEVLGDGKADYQPIEESIRQARGRFG